MKNKFKYIAIIIILVCLVLVLLPLVINYVYYLEAPIDFFVTDLKVSDFVSYYASALSFLGTLILGMLTLHQNKRAQEKTDEINRLQLEMQKKNMELAEKQYKQGTETAIPKFEVSILGYSGHYLNPRIKIRNVSAMMISDLSFISSFVRDAQGNTVRKVTDHKIKSRSLSSNSETIVDFRMLNLSTRISDREFQFYEDVEFVFEFSCEDEKYNKHYYRAVLKIPNTKDFVGDCWKITKVG